MIFAMYNVYAVSLNKKMVGIFQLISQQIQGRRVSHET